MPKERKLEHTPHTIQNPYPSSPQPSSSQPRSCHPTVQNPSPSLPSNHFQKREKKKKKKKYQTLDREERVEPTRLRTQPQIAPVSSHPNTGEIAPSHLRDRTNHLQDCAAWSTGEIAPPEALTRSHPWPTHAQSLSFSIYLSLSLNCRSLSSSLSLRLTEFFSSMNVLFWFLFRLSLYIEIFYYEICLETEKMVEKMWKTSRKITFSECNQTLENIF